MTNDMGKVRPSLEEITKFINKYISLIPMCFVSWFVWLLTDDPFMADLLFALGFWFVIPLIVWAIIVFLQSFWTKGFLWKIYMIWGCAIILLLGAFFISPTRLGTRCNPDIMAEHYEKNKYEMQELIDYANQSMDEESRMMMEFEHGDMTHFQVQGKNDSTWTSKPDIGSKDWKETLMRIVGLDNDELNNIRCKLRRIGCISIETATIHSDYTNIGFRRVGLGKYSYRIYNRSMNPEEKKEYDEDPMFIPYTDRVVFEYGGGAAGPQSFGEDIKEEFMKKHPVK